MPVTSFTGASSAGRVGGYFCLGTCAPSLTGGFHWRLEVEVGAATRSPGLDFPTAPLLTNLNVLSFALCVESAGNQPYVFLFASCVSERRRPVTGPVLLRSVALGDISPVLCLQSKRSIFQLRYSTCFDETYCIGPESHDARPVWELPRVLRHYFGDPNSNLFLQVVVRCILVR